MKQKKAQVSVFIIIGILIVLAVVYFLAIRKSSVDIEPSAPQDFSAVQVYVENCLSIVGNFAVYKIGVQGGYIEPRLNSYQSAFLDVAYAFDSIKTFVELSKMESEIETFVNENLKKCTNGFSEFGAKGISIEEGNVNSDVSFGAKNVIFSVNYPLRITSGGVDYEMEKFTSDVPVALKTVHSDVDSFVYDFDERYDLTYLNGLNSNVYIHPMGQNDMFVEENLDSSIRGENYLFLYAVR